MADDDQEQKTEEPSAKRLQEAVEKGNVITSREVNSFFSLLLLAFTLSWFVPPMMHKTRLLLLPFFDAVADIPTDRKGISLLLYNLGLSYFMLIAATMLSAIVVAIGSSVLQHGFQVTPHAIYPKFSRISPMAGFKRMFSLRSVIELIKGMAKMIIVGVVAFISVYPELAYIKQLSDKTVLVGLLFLAKLVSRMTIGVVIAMFFIALLDYLYQRYQYMKSLRMTKQEVKDEYKQSEGDPKIKNRLRQLRIERARKRMMAAVPTADVVITNPTHFAVALAYDTKIMKAPKVVAKGQDLIALRIRDLAKEHNVPVVENPPLARALFSACDLEEEIPLTHYEAVAKIISYVYQLKGRKM